MLSLPENAQLRVIFLRIHRLPIRLPLTSFPKKEVTRSVALSFPTIWSLMRKGEFPQSFAVSGRTMWLASEIDAWILSRPRRQVRRGIWRDESLPGHRSQNAS